MLKKLCHHLLATVLLLLVFFNSHGKDQICEPINVVESPFLHDQIDGASEPENIPQWLKYQIFMSYVDALIQELAPSDHAILNNLRIETEYWRQIESERYKQEFLDLCTERATMETVAVAREYERIAAESNRRGGQRVRNAIEALSLSGQHIVEEYIDQTVTPKLSFPRRNTVDLALIAPEDARYTLESMCYFYINGEPPPEEKKMMECLRKQSGVETNDESSNQFIAVGQDPEQ